ncbi:hypothetical protein G6F24_017760 [Rhizopus arrhizus]|nr:hypothetical protein G6F24_017760 [Rhizopus arrhizus]
MSAGTDRPSATRSAMTAVASRSFEQNSAVGACLPRSAAFSASASLPVWELMAICCTASRPSRLAHARAPARRRRARSDAVSGPVTSAMRRWPSAARCATMSLAAARLSTEAKGCVFDSL